MIILKKSTIIISQVLRLLLLVLGIINIYIAYRNPYNKNKSCSNLLITLFIERLKSITADLSLNMKALVNFKQTGLSRI